MLAVRFFFTLKPNIMKKLLLLFWVFLVFVKTGSAQPWERHYVADTSGFGFGVAYDLVQTGDGGYVMAGELDLATGAIRHYIQLVKTDGNGNEVWRKLLADYWDVRMDRVNGLHLMGDDGLLIGGSTFYNHQGLLVIRTDENGDTLWTKVHGFGGEISNFSRTNDDHFLSIVRTSTDLILLKVDTLGNLLLSKTLDDFFYVNDIQATSNGDYIVVGHDNGVLHLLKTNGLGDTLWTRSYQFSTGDAATCVQTLANGDFVVGGYGTGFAGQSALVARFDGNGNLLWQQYLATGVSASVRVSDIALKGNGNFVVTGSIDGDSWWALSPSDGFFEEISPTGQTVESNMFSTNYSESGSAIILTADGCYAIAGGSTQGYYLRYQCGTTGTSTKAVENIRVETFPNPSFSDIQFKIDGGEFENFELRLFDSQGKLILSKVIGQEYVLRRLTSGVYFYSLVVDDEIVKSGQVLFLD